MNLSLNTKIFYPSHGAGWVKERKEIEFAGEMRTYVDFQFITDPIVISTPFEKVKDLNIRPIINHEAIEDLLYDLSNQRKVDHKCSSFNELLVKLEELDLSGKVENFITIIQFCNFERDVRIRSCRLIPASIDKYIKQATSYLIGEYAIGKNLDLNDALISFNKITGLKINL